MRPLALPLALALALTGCAQAPPAQVGLAPVAQDPAFPAAVVQPAPVTRWTGPPAGWVDPPPMPGRYTQRGVERVQAQAAQQQAAEQVQQVQARAQQAAEVCTARGQMAEAAYPSRGIIGLDAVLAGQNVAKACMAGYQRSGVMPSF